MGWTVGLLLLGGAFGEVGADARSLLDTSAQLHDFFDRGGAGVVDAFLATTFVLGALVAAGFAIQSVLRLRGEESTGRAEPVLATAIGRRRWAAGHLAIAFGGAVIVQLATGVGTGVAYAARTGDADQLLRLTGAALGQIPAVGVLAGLAAAGFGLAPRPGVAAWLALAGAVIVALLGPLLDLPDAVVDLSPFSHSPSLPGGSAAPGMLVALTAVAAVLVAVGLAALGRRDISSGA